MNKWYFPLSNNALTKGLKDSGIETFKGQLLSSLSREIVQNSLDAKKENEENIVIEFKYFKIAKNNFPDFDGFYSNIIDSIKESEPLRDPSTKNFFLNAKEVLENDEIPFVRISDFNTHGLLGSKNIGPSNWKNLVMSSGISDKNAQAGGSFGIGKNATFACSNLHTVFYSTLDSENIEAFQGVTNLISVTKPEYNDHTQGIGYFAANKEHRPIETQVRLDYSFERKTSGTDIYIAGVRFGFDEFREGILKGVLNNFLYAIYTGMLIVKINEAIIDKSTLSYYVNTNKFILEKETIEFLEVLTNKNAIKYEDFRRGEAILYLMEDSEGSRKITAVRKPWMKITLFDGFSRSVDFKGAFIVTGNETNQLLRMMENPQHDKWETDRLDKVSKIQGDKLLKDIKRYISDKVLALHNIDNIESLELIGAEEYIKLVDDNSSKKKTKISEKISKIEVKESKEIITTQNFQPQDNIEAIIDEGYGEEAFESRKSEDDKEINPIVQNEHNIKTGKKIKIGRNQVKIAKINETTYNLFYKATNDISKINIELFPVDEEGKIIEGILKINKATHNEQNLKLHKNMIVDVDVRNGEILINIETNIKYSLSLGVNIYEINR